MKFYLPNFEDLVDPEYDFINDAYSPNRKDRFIHDHYAHEFFDKPIFDGMLVSKTVISARLEKRIQEAEGVHKFFRLKDDVPIMGDCGAYSYRNEETPPYENREILEYYETLGFTYGVSIDHLIFTSMPTKERQRRQDVTLENARKFLKQHQTGNYRFHPVGIAQGWDAESRSFAVQELIKMGYDYLALGGMARSNDKTIRETLRAIQPVLKSDIRLHIFGVARLSLLHEFLRFGVTSTDSASPLRRAFLGKSEDNYWTRDGKRYGAIRVPEVKKGGSKKRGVASTDEILKRGKFNLKHMKQKEKNVLNLLPSVPI